MRDLGAGDRIGDYVIEAATDDGYLAVHVLLPRRACLRVEPRGSQRVQRVLREACILEALRVQGVPRVFEIGVLPDGSRSRPWAALEVIGGTTLLERVRACGRIPAHEVIDVLREIADVLAYAHGRGVAHRAIRLDAIVRGDRAHAQALCLVDWSEAQLSSSTETLADDVFALGLVADLLLETRAHASPTLAALVDEMLAPDPSERPLAAEVCARAKLLLQAETAITDFTSDDDIVEEQVVLVDIISRTKTPASLPPRMRTRWTPPIALPPVPPPRIPGIPLGLVKRRS